MKSKNKPSSKKNDASSKKKEASPKKTEASPKKIKPLPSSSPQPLKDKIKIPSSAPSSNNSSLQIINHPKKSLLFSSSSTTKNNRINNDENTNEDENKETSETNAWYNECADYKLRNEHTASKIASQELINHYRKLADNIYTTEINLYEAISSKKKNKDEEWLESTIKKGTLKDRIAAMSITASDYPIHKSIAILDEFINLLHQSIKTSSDSNTTSTGGTTTQTRMISMSVEALVELFIHVLLPNDRKLISFDNRPLTAIKTHLSPKLLFLWKFEEILMQKYQQFLQFIFVQINSKYIILQDKTKLLESLGELLKSCPEQEQLILSSMINKLGDPNRKIVRKVMIVLKEAVLDEHPVMAHTMAKEVQNFMKRPNLNEKSIYNSLLFLNTLSNQRYLSSSSEEDDLSSTLYDIYFSLFESKVYSTAKKRNKNDTIHNVHSPFLSAILSGVNQIHSSSSSNPGNNKKMEQYIDTFYKIVHITTKTSPMSSVQALLLLEHFTLGSQQPQNEQNLPQVNRFYRVLYTKIHDLSRHTSKPNQYFFHALFKAMKYDTNPNRLVAFVKRVYQMTCFDSVNPSIACAMSFLISQLGTDAAIHKSLFQQRLVKNSRKVVFDSSAELQDILIPKRDPDCKDNLWEVALLQYHYHPSCSKFINDTMHPESHKSNSSYQGNPLVDFSLMHFLDKFAYKQPKKKKEDDEKNTTDRISFRSKDRAYSILANEDTFTLKPKHAVQEQDLFFHKYFVDKKQKNKHSQDEHEESMDTAADDDIINDLNIKNDDMDDENYDSDEDPEEEAFATKLVEQLLVQKSKSKGKNQSVQDLDDEDPHDLDDWSYNTDDNSDDGNSDDDDDNDDDDDFPNFLEEEEEEEEDTNKNDRKKKKSEIAVFADADDYDDIINKKNKKRKGNM